MENNKKVIVRGTDSGIFFGTIIERNGREVKLVNCRRIFYWEGAASISQIAVDGVAKPDKCKFTVPVPEIEILDVVEIIPCTEKAISNIESVWEWKA